MNPAKDAKGAAAKAADAVPAHEDLVYLEIEDWREKAAEDPDSLKGYGVRVKGPSAEVKQPDPANDQELDYVVSTEEQDRDGDVIHAAGWDWKNFLRGGPGPVLFGHDRKSLPVAKCPRVDTIGLAQVARAVYPTAAEAGFEANQPFLANTVRCLSLNGFLKSTSVGFLPVEWTFNEDTCGFEFHEQEGLEWSVVPVPANPGCFRLAAAKGIDLSPLGEWASQALDEIHGRKGLYVTRSKLELVLRSCGLDPDAGRFFDLSDARIKAALRGKKTPPAAAVDEAAVLRVLSARGLDVDRLVALVERSADPDSDPVNTPGAPAESTVASVAVVTAPDKDAGDESDEVLVELAAEEAPAAGEVLLDFDLAELRAELKETLRAGVVGALNEQTPRTGQVW